MRFSRAVSLMLAAAAVAGLSMVLASCGGGGGGSSSGPTVDNSKATGTFSVVMIDASSGIQTDTGTVVLDGNGSGVYTSLTNTHNNGNINYTVTVPGNTISFDSATKGTLSKDGNFFAAIDTESGTPAMIYGVKQGTAVSEPTASYVGSEFTYSSGSEIYPFMIETATPTAGIITYTDLLSMNTSSTDYSYAADGTFTVPSTTPDILGTISNDENIMIFANSAGALPDAALALKIPGSGMTDASLSGTYIAYEFADSDVSGGSSIDASRIKLTLNGDGTGTYEILYSTDPSNTGSGFFTYVMDPSGVGTFIVNGYLFGVTLQDGSMFELLDVDPTDNGNDNMISMLVAIKQ